MEPINTKSEKLDNFIFIAVLILFSIVSLVPFFAMKHIKIMYLPIHYLIVGGSVSILVILTLYNQKWKLTSFDKWLFVLMFGFSLSLITSVDRLYTLWTLVSFSLRGIVIAFVVHKIVISEKRKNLLVLVLLSVASIVCLIGLVEFFTGRIPLFHNFYLEHAELYPISFGSRSGMISTIGHPLVLSAYLVLLLPVSAWFLQDKKLFVRFIPFILFFLTVFLSFSRSSWIATFLMLIIYFWKEKEIIFSNKKYFIIVVVILGLIFTSPRIKDTFLGRISFKRMQLGIKSTMAILHRYNSYETTWNIAKQYPFFGVGMGNYPKIHDVFRAEGTDEDIKTPDNMYLRFISEVGLVGTLTFFSFIFYWLYQLWKNRDNSFIWAIFVGLVGFLVNQMAADFFCWLVPQFLFWFMLGLGMASLNNGYK